jgi:hypothetical protein
MRHGVVRIWGWLRGVSAAYAGQRGHCGTALGAGVLESWMGGEGVELRNLRTPDGQLSYHLRHVGSQFELTVAATLAVPPGGLVMRLPPGADGGTVRVNGRPAQFEGDELRITQLPSHVVIAAK